VFATAASADPYDPGERAIGGGLIGAGTGAVIGAIAGGGRGAGIGAAVGGGLGAVAGCHHTTVPAPELSPPRRPSFLLSWTGFGLLHRAVGRDPQRRL